MDEDKNEEQKEEEKEMWRGGEIPNPHVLLVSTRTGSLHPQSRVLTFTQITGSQILTQQYPVKHPVVYVPSVYD